MRATPLARRAAAAAAIFAVMIFGPRAASAAGEPDMFGALLRQFGEPELAHKVPADEAARDAGVLPRALLSFWTEHGRGSYKEGAFWICDPRPFKPLLGEIFAGDPEFNPKRMSVIGYSAFGTLLIWDRLKKQVSVNLLFSTVHNVPEEKRIDQNTGQPFSDDFTIGTFINGMQYYDEPLFSAAVQRLGRLGEDEIYGFVPALQLGGAFAAENLHKMRVFEHAAFIARLRRMTLTRLTTPDPPRYPYGRTEMIRPIGPNP